MEPFVLLLFCSHIWPIWGQYLLRGQVLDFPCFVGILDVSGFCTAGSFGCSGFHWAKFLSTRLGLLSPMAALKPSSVQKSPCASFFALLAACLQLEILSFLSLVHLKQGISSYFVDYFPLFFRVLRHLLRLNQRPLLLRPQYPSQRARGSKKFILARTHEKTIPPRTKFSFSLEIFILSLKFSFSIENFNPRPCFSAARERPEWNFHSRLKISFRIESLIFSISPLEIDFFQSWGPLGSLEKKRGLGKVCRTKVRKTRKMRKMRTAKRRKCRWLALGWLALGVVHGRDSGRLIFIHHHAVLGGAALFDNSAAAVYKNPVP